MAITTAVDFHRRTLNLPQYPARTCSFAAKGDAATIVIDGVIGEMFGGVSSSQFSTDLQKLGAVKTINILINSPGGIVTDGRAIYNRLKAHPAKKVVTIDGEASSIASLVAMAGNEIRMAEGSLMLVHRAWMFTIGNVDDHRKTMADLETVDQTLIATYMAKTGKSADVILSLMKEDRYMGASEAVKFGFVDIAEGESKMAAWAVDRPTLRLPALPVGRAAAKPQPNMAKANAALERMTARPTTVP